jgi:hypothetical protein
MSQTRDGAAGDGDRPAGSTPAPEAIFDALESDLRRAVLFVLTATDSPIDVDRLIDGLPVDVSDGASDHLTPESTAAAVRRDHLPALERVGIVRYDRGRGVVRAPADLTWLVALLRETERFDGR